MRQGTLYRTKNLLKTTIDGLVAVCLVEYERICPTTPQKQVQFNTVFPTQIKMDRVGFEPTTSSPKYGVKLPLIHA
jgi:hypothetical protein